MSREGLKIALENAEQLPAFRSLEEAEQELLAERDRTLRDFPPSVPGSVNLDYSAESLKGLEEWFFSQSERKRRSFVCLGLGYYFGEVFCRNAGFQWIVARNPFAEGRYDIGVTKGNMTITVTRGLSPVEVGNKKHQSLYRNFKKWSAI